MKKFRVVIPMYANSPSCKWESLPVESEIEIYLIKKGVAYFTVGTIKGEYHAPVSDIMLSCTEYAVCISVRSVKKDK